MRFVEKDIVDQFRRENIKDFYQYLEQYDEQVATQMRAAGWKCKNTAKRTVLFTFGEVEIERKRWYKKGQCRIPVDEMLGLEKHSRYSRELLYQVAKVARELPYRKVANLFEQLYGIVITKDTVYKAVKLSQKLLAEREEYRFYEENQQNQPKIKPDTLYIEGDGVWLKTCEKEEESRHREYSHFLIHTGSEQVEPNRFELQNKKEIFSKSNHQARKKLLDYLYNHIEVRPNTILITNSDNGRGYSPHVFKEVAKALKVKRHEHFWDKFHVYQDIDTLTKNSPEEVRDLFHRAIQTNDKQRLRIAFDTLESLLREADEEQNRFDALKKKFYRNFQYTKPARLRGLSLRGIGVMESQHRKITYRMKHRGMYWSEGGGETIARLTILSDQEIRDLFFGDWREKYAYFQELESLSAEDFRDDRYSYKQGDWMKKINGQPFGKVD